MAESRPWHAHYPPGVAAWPEFENITLSKALQRTSERFPEKSALYYMGKKISYREWFHDLQEGEGSMLAVFPFFHAAGFTAIQCSCVFSGLTDVLVPRPEPTIIIDIMKKAKPQFVPGVPTIYVGLLNNPLFRKLDHRHVRAFTAGAAPLPLETIQDLKGLTGKGIINVYGLTESSAMATATPVAGTDKPETAGLPLPATDIKIVDLEDGAREMPVGEPGEVVIKGPQIMQGYYNRPEATAAVLQNGWLHTGDIGRMDEEGFLTLVDRKKDMIIASGFDRVFADYFRLFPLTGKDRDLWQRAYL